MVGWADAGSPTNIVESFVGLRASAPTYFSIAIAPYQEHQKLELPDYLVQLESLSSTPEVQHPLLQPSHRHFLRKVQRYTF